MKKKVNTIIEKRKTNITKFLKDVWVILNKPYMMALPGQIASAPWAAPCALP